MATVYASCDTANVDPSTNACSAVVWVDASPNWIQPLSISDAEKVGSSVLVVWAIAFAYVLVRRTITG